MGESTAISWTDHTFNPWWGCVRVSPGCENCYAETFSHRLGLKLWGPGSERRFFGDKHWNEPLKWNRAAEKAGVPAKVFCASMADVFEDRRDLAAPRARLWALIEATPFLRWQLLTKRPENWRRLVPASWLNGWPYNVWALVTAENQEMAERRIPILLNIPARIRGVSYEPAVGPIDFGPYLPGNCSSCGEPYDDSGGCASCEWMTDSPGVNWIIVGGESGARPRPFKMGWLQDTISYAADTGARVFFKQSGRYFNDIDGRAWETHDHKAGADPSQWPEWARVREFPE